MVLRTQLHSVSARFWWWFQDAPDGDRADVSIVPVLPARQTCWHNSSNFVFSAMHGIDPNKSLNPFNPFLAMYVAVTRRTESGRVIGPGHRVSREQALRM